MIFNQDLLFIHVPKTGGMAVTRYLFEVLPRPVYFSHPDHDPLLEKDGVVQIRGSRHENLEEARTLVHGYGLELEQFRAVIAVIRNPYHMEVSRFAYLRKGQPWDKGYNQDLALAGDFEKFAIYSNDHAGKTRPIQSYFRVDGLVPTNLRILRTENLESDLKGVLHDLGIRTDRPVVRRNESDHRDPMTYYTRLAEEAVYRRYQWVFDCGLYSRMNAETRPATPMCAICGPRIPLSGPVRQAGISSGLWPDSWVGHQVSFHIRPDVDIKKIIIEGTFPVRYRDKVELKVDINGSVVTYSSALQKSNTPVRLEVGYFLFEGISARIAITSSACWSPRETTGSADNRELSFQLLRVTFEY